MNFPKTNRTTRIFLPVIFILLLAVSATTASAATLTVTKTADTKDGACNADCSLREAIAAAAPGDVIGFASPLFDTAQTITLSDAADFRELVINKSLTVEGRGARLLTVRRAADAAAPFRIFRIGDGLTVRLSGMTVTGGAAADNGGGVLTFGSTTTIADCHITGNTANGVGGGIFQGPNSATVSSLTVQNSTVSNNLAVGTAGGGGGIHSLGRTLNVTNSTVSGNVKHGAESSGGIWTDSAAITASTVTDNETSGAGSGGGIRRNNGAVSIGNSIVAANRNNEPGGTPDVTARGSAIGSLGYNLIGNAGTIAAFNQPGDQVGDESDALDPELGELGDNGGATPTHALEASSSAIDRGKSFNLTGDQRGQPRPFDRPNLPPATGGDHADIGAFEAQATANVAPRVSATPSPITTDENTPVNIGLIATDANADPLTLTLTDQPDNGTLSGFDPTPECSIRRNRTECFGSVSYSPNHNFVGTDSFSLKANDGQLDSTVLTVNITVRNVVEIYTVTKTADTADGVCDAADCSLREAIAAAGADDEIRFASPLFDTAQTITLSEEAGFQKLVINKSLTIAGRGALLLTVRRAADAIAQFRIFEIAGDAAVNLRGMTIMGGRLGISGAGGAIYNPPGNTLTITESHLTGNHAGTGTIQNRGTLIVERSALTNNTATSNGGGTAGIFHEGGTLSLISSTVSGNVKTGGTGNSSGGILANNAPVFISGSTITDNGIPANSTSAGGIRASNAAVTIRNSIVAANRNNSNVPDVLTAGSGAFVSEGYNLIGNAGAATGFDQIGDQTGNHALPLDPRLLPLALLGGATPTHGFADLNSPAIDKGKSFGATTDQRGMPRPFDLSSIAPATDGDDADIGAFESQGATAATVSVAGRILTTGGAAGLRNARVTLTDAGGNSRTVSSGKTGAFRFAEIPAGETYIISIAARRYVFQTQILTVTEDVTDLIFTAQQGIGGGLEVFSDVNRE